MYSLWMTEADLLEFFTERAAIIQFDGGRTRPDADFYAAILTRRLAEAHGIEIQSHWLRSISRIVAAEWSEAEGKAVVKREKPSC
jgi:hypothetical protein